MRRIIVPLVIFVSTFGAGILGSLFVSSQIASWYAGLNKPPLTPPDIVFPIVWTLLYALMVIAASLIWLRPRDKHVESWVKFYFVQLFVNAAWTIFFFGFHAITIAFIDILALIYMVMGLCIGAWTIDRRAAYLLLPYLAWVLFATYLTLGIWWLN